MGLQEALWPDYFETVTSLPGYTKRWTYGDNYVGRSPRLGQALNFAKMFLFDRMGGSQEGARTHFEIVTLFGDPHMHFQPWNDTRLTATHPASVSAILADFNVSVVNQLGVAVAGAAVTITSTAGENVSYTTGGSGACPCVLCSTRPGSSNDHGGQVRIDSLRWHDQPGDPAF